MKKMLLVALLIVGFYFPAWASAGDPVVIHLAVNSCEVPYRK